MLWFSIPLVILLALIPVLIVVSQTTRFRVTFETKVAVVCFIIAALSAFQNYWFATVLNTFAMVLWLCSDKDNAK